MIRVVLTVIVAVAVLAASLPAIETARTATTAEQIDAETVRLERAIGGVVSGSTPVSDPSMAARTTAIVRVPTGFTAAPVARATLVDAEGDGVALAYRIDGGPERTLPIEPGTGAATVALEDGPIDLRAGGRSRLDIRYVDEDGPSVRIARTG